MTAFEIVLVVVLVCLWLVNPNPAAGSESVVVHAFGPRTSGEAS